MAMYYYASKISALACGTRCKQTVLQKSRGQRDRDKFNRQQCSHCHQRHRQRRHQHHHSTDDDDDDDDDGTLAAACNAYECDCTGIAGDDDDDDACCRNDGIDGGIFALDTHNCTADTSLATLAALPDGIRFRRRHSEQLDAYDLDLRFQQIELPSDKSSKAASNLTADGDIVQYDIPKNSFMRSQCDVNFESSVLGSGGIMYINGRIVSGPLDSLIEVLVPKNIIDLDKEFIFAFLLSSRLFLRPHELLGKLLAAVPDSECLESLVALLAEWTQKFPYDYRDERMMSHVKHIAARCSNSHLEVIVSDILSALLKRLTDLERHEADLRACQTNNDKLDSIKTLDCPTATQYAQILCRLEKKLAKHVGPEEFLQCNSNVLMDKQKKWDQPSTLGGPPGTQDPKKTCNLETYLDWSARLRLFVCNEILQCSGIRDRSKTVELWSGVAQYCLLVGNYNSATAILESLESPPIARLKITWSKLQVTCQQLDCMQRHAEGHGDLWQKQAIVLNENHHQQQQQKLQQQQQQQAKTELASALLSTTSSTASATATATASSPSSTMTTTATINTTSTSIATPGAEVSPQPPMLMSASGSTMIVGVDVCATSTTSGLHATENMTTGTTTPLTLITATDAATTATSNKKLTKSLITTTAAAATTSSASTSAAAATTSSMRPNDWVVIPVFADIVKLALAAREACLQRLPNGHININAFDRMAAIVGAFTRHMQAVKSGGNEAATTAASSSSSISISSVTASTSSGSGSGSGEYELFCRHMQKTSKLSETELMMASFDCEEPNNAEKLMYDLN